MNIRSGLLSTSWKMERISSSDPTLMGESYAIIHGSKRAQKTVMGTVRLRLNFNIM